MCCVPSRAAAAAAAVVGVGNLHSPLSSSSSSLAIDARKCVAVRTSEGVRHCCCRRLCRR